MRKADLSNRIRENLGGLSKKEAGTLTDAMLASLSDVLAAGESVKFSGFGTFHVRSKTRRVGRNPHSGSELVIPARKVLTFRPSQVLRDLMNP